MNRNKHLKPFFALWAMLLITFACSDNKDMKVSDDVPFTATVVMDTFVKMSPQEGARFYASNREEYPFLDTLYRDSVLPFVGYCDYYEMKQTARELAGTPYFDKVNGWLGKVRGEYLSTLSKEIQDNGKLQKEVFAKTVLPVIEMDVDSMLEEDIKDIIDDYAGGLFNWHKLAFIFGRNRDDFKDMFWDKFDVDKYTEHIEEHVKAYFDITLQQQNSYCKNITGKDFNEPMKIEYPEFMVGLSPRTLKHVQEYTHGETKEMTEEAIRDWVVPAALGLASGGTSLPVNTIYGIGTLAYDIKVTIDDIKAQKLDNDDRLAYVCRNDVSFQIRDYYLDKWTAMVNKAIDENNKKLYEKISAEL